VKTLNYYLSYIYNLRKSRFIKDVSIVAGGTAIAQLITMAFSPIITRLYGPDAFGILGVFNSVVGIIVPIASLTYVHAIVLPASDEDAKLLVKLSFLITVFVFIASLVIIYPFNQQIAHMISFETSPIYLLLIPLVVAFSSFEQILRQWLIRKKQFKSISGIAVLQAVLKGSLKSIFGYFYAIAPALIVLNALGHLLHTYLLWVRSSTTIAIRVLGNVKELFNQIPDFKKVAYTYRDFPD